MEARRMPVSTGVLARARLAMSSTMPVRAVPTSRRTVAIAVSGATGQPVGSVTVKLTCISATSLLLDAIGQHHFARRAIPHRAGEVVPAAAAAARSYTVAAIGVR